MNESEVVKVSDVEEVRDTLQKRLDNIEDDSRYQQDDADVQINAPLALLQTALKGQHTELSNAIDLLEDLLPNQK